MLAVACLLRRTCDDRLLSAYGVVYNLRSTPAELGQPSLSFFTPVKCWAATTDERVCSIVIIITVYSIEGPLAPGTRPYTPVHRREGTRGGYICISQRDPTPCVCEEANGEGACAEAFDHHSPAQRSNRTVNGARV